MMHTIAARTGLAGVGTAILFAASFALAGVASATPADPVADGLDELQSKVATYGTAVVALVVAVVVLFFGIKFLKRGASKAAPRPASARCGDNTSSMNKGGSYQGSKSLGGSSGLGTAKSTSTDGPGN